MSEGELGLSAVCSIQKALVADDLGWREGSDVLQLCGGLDVDQSLGDIEKC